MARIRTIKPEFFTDDTIAALPLTTRLTFIGLWTYTDDAGRGLDNTALIKAAIWPLDRNHTEKKINTDLTRLTTAGRICRYTTDGRHVLHVIRWRNHQVINRPTPSKLPPCPHHDNTADSVNDSRSGSLTGSRIHSVNGTGTLTDDAVSDSLASRAPAEGKGREGKGREPLAAADGDGPADRPDPMPQPGQARTPTAAALDRTGPWVTAVRQRLEPVVRELLAAGHPVDVVEAALRVWRGRPKAQPGLLPLLVQDELAARGGGGVRVDPHDEWRHG